MALNCHIALTRPWRCTAKVSIGGTNRCVSIGNRPHAAKSSSSSYHCHTDDARHPGTTVSQALAGQVLLPSHPADSLRQTAASTAHFSSVASPRPCGRTTFPYLKGSSRFVEHHYHPVAQGPLLTQNQPQASQPMKSVHFHACKMLETCLGALHYDIARKHTPASLDHSRICSPRTSPNELPQTLAHSSPCALQLVHQASNVFNNHQRPLLSPQRGCCSLKAFSTGTEQPPSHSEDLANTTNQRPTTGTQLTLSRDHDAVGDANTADGSASATTPPGRLQEVEAEQYFVFTYLTIFGEKNCVWKL